MTSLLETTSLRYPTQTAFSTQLAELYGASFGMNVNKKGDLHQVNAAMSFVNGKYVADEELFTQAVFFLKEVLFSQILFKMNLNQKFYDRKKQFDCLYEKYC